MSKVRVVLIQIWNPVHFDEYIDLSRYVEGFKAPVPVSTDESTKSTSALPESSGEEPIVWASPSPVTAPSPTRETLGGERVSSVDVPSVSRPAFSSFTYRLVALVEHEGPAMDQGHYVCYVKHMNLNEWFRANDKVIEPADLEGSVLSACPYMLFYQRVLLDATATPVSLGEAPNICLAKDVAHTNHGFSGLFEQAKIAKGIGKGKWSTWQHLISGLGEPFPGRLCLSLLTCSLVLTTMTFRYSIPFVITWHACLKNSFRIFHTLTGCQVSMELVVLSKTTSPCHRRRVGAPLKEKRCSRTAGSSRLSDTMDV